MIVSKSQLTTKHQETSIKHQAPMVVQSGEMLDLWTGGRA